MASYHPRRRDKEILDQEQLTGILKAGKYMTLALARVDEPYIVTLSYGYDRDSGNVYFHSSNHGDKLDFIRANGRVCATVIQDRGYLDGKCDHDYASLVIRGRMAVVTDLAEKKHALLTLLGHLEKDPQPILERNIKNDASYDAVTILRLDIDSLRGKAYSA
ncbi:MAG: pyridoxamine 5'-phosphate oxidase family protein [Spirochaetia bacterium]|nr:pyridoxamine 5'-phosphate oxidase family protein [Spirochaetia bacterium]